MSLNQSKMSSLSDKIEATKEIQNPVEEPVKDVPSVPSVDAVATTETVESEKVVKVKRRLNK